MKKDLSLAFFFGISSLLEVSVIVLPLFVGWGCFVDVGGWGGKQFLRQIILAMNIQYSPPESCTTFRI